MLALKKKREESRQYVVKAGEDIKALRELASTQSALLAKLNRALSENYTTMASEKGHYFELLYLMREVLNSCRNEKIDFAEIQNGQMLVNTPAFQRALRKQYHELKFGSLDLEQSEEELPSIYASGPTARTPSKSSSTTNRPAASTPGSRQRTGEVNLVHSSTDTQPPIYPTYMGSSKTSAKPADECQSFTQEEVPETSESSGTIFDLMPYTDDDHSPDTEGDVFRGVLAENVRCGRSTHW